MSWSIAFAAICALTIAPQNASAGIFSAITPSAEADAVGGDLSGTILNSQVMPLADPQIGPSTLSATAADTDNAPAVVSDTMLAPQIGPLGSAADVAALPDTTGQIGVYTVHAGDTVGSIAAMFGVSKNTILSANDLKQGAALKEGTVLAILPVSGTEYSVVSGDTVSSIAKRFKADPAAIALYNDLDVDSTLDVGDTIVIPDGGVSAPDAAVPSSDSTASASSKKSSSSSKSSKGLSGSGSSSVSVPMNAEGLDTTNKNGANPTPITVHPVDNYSKVNLGDAIRRPVPISVSHLSQGAHGFAGSAVDLAAPLGTPIMAAADGVVQLARTGGYNDGYGNYVIIMSNIDGHQVQTIYAHMSKVIATAGETVSRGETIGLVGMTGDATGDHVHFEVRGALNPLTIDPDYTGE